MNRRRPWDFLLLAVAMVAACGGCTPYKQLGLMGGVDDLQLNQRSYRVFARGNGFSSSERVHNFILLRASQLAIVHGYEGFIVDSSENQTESSTIVTPGYATTTTLSGFSTTTFSPPIISSIRKPAYMVYVTLVHQGGINAKLVFDRLAPEYGVTSITDTLPKHDIPRGASFVAASLGSNHQANVGAEQKSYKNGLHRFARSDQPPQPARRPLGIVAEPLFPSESQPGGSSYPIGLLVVTVEPNGAASIAGLRRGDVILSLSGTIIRSRQDIEQVLQTVSPGRIAVAEILRNGDRRIIDIPF